MQYNWDIIEIQNDINKLKLMIGKTDNDELVSDYINLCYQMIDCVSKNEYIEDENDELNINDLVQMFFQEMEEKDCKLADILIDSYHVVKDFKCNNFDTEIDCSDDTLVKKTDDFLKKYTNQTIYDQYLELKRKNPNYLHITKCANSESSTHGLTFINSLLKRKNIILFRDNTFVDLVTLPHEIFHAVFNDYDSYKAMENQCYYSTEIEGSFANLLACEYYRKDYPDIARDIDKYFLNNYKGLLIQLIVGFSYLNSCNDKNKFRINKFNKLLSTFGINKLNDELLRYYLTDSGSQIINYGISYLASIDLLNIYKNDKELAFYLLKNIRFIKQEDNILNILRRNHITFMDDGYENLKKYVKKIERMK